MRGDRISVHANKRPIFGSFTVSPPLDTTLRSGGSAGASLVRDGTAATTSGSSASGAAAAIKNGSRKAPIAVPSPTR